MKKIFFALVIACSCFAIISCSEKPKEPAVFDAYTSSSTCDVNGSVTFTDESTGVISRTWTFPYGASIATSSDAEVTVTFSAAGPATCHLCVNFNDGTSEDKDFTIQVGNELLGRGAYGFEDEAIALLVWSAWSPAEGGYEFSIDKTQGANGTSQCMKLVISNKDQEIQLLTRGTEYLQYNANLPAGDYTLSFYAKADGITNISAVDVQVNDPWASVCWQDGGTVTSSWNKCSYDFTVETPLTGAGVLIKMLSDKTGTLYVDEVSISKR